MVDTSELDIGNINPFRYRSYYYDKETGWYYLNSRYYNPFLCRFITMDSVEYLGASGSMLSLNLYAYCENNPVIYVDPDGYFPWLILLAASLIAAVVLDGHSTYKHESRINEMDLNINGDNPLGEIKIEINETSIKIVDSYKIQNEKDMEKIINIVMNHHYYNMYGYDRSERSYLSEWKAHNAAYSFYKKGNWGDRTISVNLNKNIKEDKFRFVYWIFFD